jgi:general secretion pathway protein I
MRRPRGFTLLEVLVAVAILGLGLATILSAQAGAFASASHARHVSVATGLLRCKMTEIEEHLYRDGFQLTDENGEGQCCDLDETPDMHCAWRIEQPQFPDSQLGDLDLQSSLSLGGGATGSGSGAGALGALGLLAGAAGQGQGAGAGANPLAGASSISDIATTLANANSTALAGAGTSAPLGYAAPPGSTSVSGMPTAPSADGSGSAGDGMGGLASLAMSFVYPSLKILFEASTRRITTTLTFHEGKKEYTIDVVEWFCLPQQGLAVDDGSATSATSSSSGSPTGAGGPRPGSTTGATKAGQ